VIDGGSAADHGSGGDVVGDAALGDGDGPVSDFYVPAYAYLSGQDYVVAHVGGAGQAHLGADQRVVSYGAAVADVDEIVQFSAAPDAGLAYAGSVDASVGLEFGIALYDNVAGLDNLVPAVAVVFVVVFILGEAETVAAYDGAILQQNVVSQLAEFSYDGVRVGEEIVAYGYSAIDDHVGEEDGVVSDYYAFVDYYIGAEVRVLAELGCVMNYRGGMDSGGVAWRAVEKFYGLCPG
jgi:hypothetical protein